MAVPRRFPGHERAGWFDLSTGGDEARHFPVSIGFSDIGIASTRPLRLLRAAGYRPLPTRTGAAR